MILHQNLIAVAVPVVVVEVVVAWTLPWDLATLVQASPGTHSHPADSFCLASGFLL